MYYITHRFMFDGVPATGLNPTITIWDLDTDLIIVESSVMSEIKTSGIYKYGFSKYKTVGQYAYQIDGGSYMSAYFDTANALAVLRYPWGQISQDNQYYNMRDLGRKLK